MLSGIIDSMTVIEKRCSSCGTMKPRAEFYSDQYKRDGLMHRCKECDRARCRKAYAHNVGRPVRPTTPKLRRDPVCTVDGCNKPHASLGYCAAHYKRVRTHGTVELPPRTKSAGRKRTEHVECLSCGTEFERYKLSNARKGKARQLCGTCRTVAAERKPKERTLFEKKCEYCAETFSTEQVAQRFCRPVCRVRHGRATWHKPGKVCRGCGADMSTIKHKHYCAACRPSSYDKTVTYEWDCVDCHDQFISYGRSYTRCPDCIEKRDNEIAARQVGKGGGDHIKRAKAAGVPYEYINVRKVYDRDEWTCGICYGVIDPDVKYPDPKSVSLDHVLPISLGGPHTYDNVQAAHLKCNVDKGNSVGF